MDYPNIIGIPSLPMRGGGVDMITNPMGDSIIPSLSEWEHINLAFISLWFSQHWPVQCQLWVHLEYRLWGHCNDKDNAHFNVAPSFPWLYLLHSVSTMLLLWHPEQCHLSWDDEVSSESYICQYWDGYPDQTPDRPGHTSRGPRGPVGQLCDSQPRQWPGQDSWTCVTRHYPGH